MTEPFTARNFAVVYFAIGAVVCLVHPRLLRPAIAELWSHDVNDAGFFRKSFAMLAIFLLYSALWPIGWFNVEKSEKKAKKAIHAQLERLRPFMMFHAAMNAPANCAGGDGSSFEEAVIIRDATLMNGPKVAYTFIEQRYPGCQHDRQTLKQENGKTYDVLEFTTAEGELKTMYFDISAHLPSVARTI